MAGECFDFRVDYDKLSSFVGSSLGEAEFWQIVRQFVETLQVKNAKKLARIRKSSDFKCAISILLRMRDIYLRSLRVYLFEYFNTT